jgi:hypothetical protein
VTRQKKPEGCPVCLVSEAMIVNRRKGWACRGCGSDGVYLGAERVVDAVPADDPFDYRERRGERAGIVKQIKADLRKIEREAKAA